MIYFESQDLGPLLFLSEGLTIKIQTATPDDLLDPMTVLLSHPKWLVVRRGFKLESLPILQFTQQIFLRLGEDVI